MLMIFVLALIQGFNDLTKENASTISSVKSVSSYNASSIYFDYSLGCVRILNVQDAFGIVREALSPLLPYS